ncbi:MAG TPA: histidine kinase [Saprospiraceae bacterium]|nr:histidine kinase [Saprospiraceae bacterium]
MPVKRYSSKEPLVFVWIMIPYIFFMNLSLFGYSIFQSLPDFFRAFGISAIYFFIVYAVFGSIAVLIKNTYPSAGDMFLRVRLMLPSFYIMNIGAIYGVYYLYSYTAWIEAEPKAGMIWWTILYGCVMSTVITFINEGMANWEKWKNSLAEGEKLKNAYQRSKLLGLKGQINPHFLFNCFNTLSGLIDENEEKAEQFLDEMTKVHRYLLRGDDEYLVPLEDELKFASSYLYLIKARFGESFHTEIDIPRNLLNKRIPPLSMQVLLENILYTNVLSKKEPLHISICSNGPEQICIRHNAQEKTIVQSLQLEEGLDNLMTKYRLLNAPEIQVIETRGEREVILPLFTEIPEHA